MTAHKHAALMLQYAQDAAETDTPWERWEFKTDWDTWVKLSKNPSWFEDRKYRRKPQVIRVGRHEFPKPISEAPEVGTEYWIVRAYSTGGHSAEKFVWKADPIDYGLMRNSLAHLSQEAAQAHADTLNAICRGDID